jgi:hypothetical protein
MKIYYKYCKIIKEVITAAKKMAYKITDENA